MERLFKMNERATASYESIARMERANLDVLSMK
jgi:hypothetical protein